MSNGKNYRENEGGASLFMIIPTIMLIIGYFIFPYEQYSNPPSWLQIPMFLGLFLLGIGFFLKKYDLGNFFKIFGWFVFSFYWATQPIKMYVTEGGDVFNAVVGVIGVYVLCYLAYHEWLSLVRKERISCLNWIAGASFFAGIIYFGIERTALGEWLTAIVAEHSEWILNSIIGNSSVCGVDIYLDGIYAVSIIFACTALQAMVVFVGMIGALPKVDSKRKILGLLITLVPIYILNLFRNAMVAFLVGKNITSFNIAHNVLSKLGALITLIVLLVILIKLIPEIFDELLCLIDLPKRKGPIEQSLSEIFRRKK